MTLFVHTRLVVLALGFVALVSSRGAEAAPPLAGREGFDRRAWMQGGWDPAPTIAMGADIRLVRPSSASQLYLDVGYRAPVVLVPTFSGWELGGGATFFAGWPRTSLAIALSLRPLLRHSTAATGSMTGFGIATGARPGMYSSRASLALDLEMANMLTTHISHSDAVRALYDDRVSFDGPRDGWYSLTSRRLRMGLAGGWSPLDTITVHLQLGWTTTRQLEGIVTNPPTSPVPFYVEAGGGYRW